MKTLGIYFGPKMISLVETEAQKVINNVQIPLRKLLGTGVEEKVPEEIKIAAAIKDELRKNNIEAKEAGLVLLGRDLIIRTFHMPVLPANELFTAVRFEAKKYIPFKVEDLVYDFQIFLDKVNRKNLVLFVGVKKDSLEKYISIFTQLNIKINSIEYAGFSVLRLIQLAKIKEKGVSAVVDIDLFEEDEVNFMVLENGFPLFSRDIIIASDTVPLEGAEPQKIELGQSLEKLKVELRISLDFYLRKFPTKNIASIVVIAPEDYRNEIESFVRERGIAVKFVESKKIVDRPVSFSLGFLKAYAVSLKKNLKNDILIDLLPTKVKAKSQATSAGSESPVVFGFKFDFRMLLLGAGIVAIPYGINYYRSKPVQAELNSVIAQRPPVSTVDTSLGTADLEGINTKYKEKYRVISEILKKRMFVTEQLDSLPRVIPEGIWLRNLEFRQSGSGFVMSILGSCYLADSNKEMKLINKFLGELKADKNFGNNFQEINVLSVDQVTAQNNNMTNFSLECRSK